MGLLKSLADSPQQERSEFLRQQRDQLRAAARKHERHAEEVRQQNIDGAEFDFHSRLRDIAPEAWQLPPTFRVPTYIPWLA